MKNLKNIHRTNKPLKPGEGFQGAVIGGTLKKFDSIDAYTLDSQRRRWVCYTRNELRREIRRLTFELAYLLPPIRKHHTLRKAA